MSMANVAFAAPGSLDDVLGTERFVSITTESGNSIQLDELPLPPNYFNSWLLAIIYNTWLTYILSGPTLFNWGQVVLVNPVAVSSVFGGQTISTNEVFNPNLNEISILDSRSLWILPNDFVPSGVIPV